jgi:hypothetical protein
MRRVGRDNWKRRQRQVENFLDELPRLVEEKFREYTPIDTGNARRSTDLQNNNEITANYNYANRLNTGWSKQAPNGMTEPTIAHVRRKLREL